MPLGIDAVSSRIRHHDQSLDNELQELARVDPMDCVQLLRAVLFSDALYMEVGACAYVLAQLRKLFGSDSMDSWLSEKWSTFSDEERSRICYGSMSKEAMPTETAVRLFASPATSLKDKHQLLAGLASSAEVRHCESLVYNLANQLATNTPLSASPRLADLIENIRLNFAPLSTPGKEKG